MSDNRYQRLLEPGYIGKGRTRNRIIKTANGTSFIEPTGQGEWHASLGYQGNEGKNSVTFTVVIAP